MKYKGENMKIYKIKVNGKTYRVELENIEVEKDNLLFGNEF